LAQLVFEQLDCLKETERLCELAAGCTKLFVDIGGNRELPALVCVLRVVLQRLRPPLVVVKNEAMYRYAPVTCYTMFREPLRAPWNSQWAVPVRNVRR